MAAFFCLFWICVFVFCFEVALHVRAIRGGRASLKVDHKWARVHHALSAAFGQRTVRERWWGYAHIIIFYALNYLTYSFDYVRKIIEISGIENETIASILKITVIANLIDFTAITIEEFGLRSLSDKLIFCGKIIIFTISAPLIYSVFELIVGLLQ